MRYVLDASVALKWVLPEPDADDARALRERFVAGVHELIAPDIFPVEVAHVLSKAERQKKIEPGDGAALLADLLSTPPTWRPSLPLIAEAFAIASETRSSLYDCLYLALAEREGCELVTADEALVRKLVADHPSIVRFSSLDL